MPLYEYQCDGCGHRFEHIQKFSDPLVSECPRCGGSVQKQISSPAFQFKGSGWYATDYARKPEPAAAGKGDAKGDGQGAESKAADKESGPKGGKEAGSRDGKEAASTGASGNGAAPASSTKPS